MLQKTEKAKLRVTKKKPQEPEAQRVVGVSSSMGTPNPKPICEKVFGFPSIGGPCMVVVLFPPSTLGLLEPLLSVFNAAQRVGGRAGGTLLDRKRLCLFKF